MEGIVQFLKKMYFAWIVLENFICMLDEFSIYNNFALVQRIFDLFSEKSRVLDFRRMLTADHTKITNSTQENVEKLPKISGVC